MKHVLVITLVALTTACAAAATDGEPTDESSDALHRSSSSSYGATTLKYEGTCAFLHDCSTWSKKAPSGSVLWGCSEYDDDDGYGACSDSALWVAGPSASYCGKSVKICKGSTCVTAKVKDISVSHSWEGSNGVFDALDLEYGLDGRCSGHGGGSVKITAQ